MKQRESCPTTQSMLSCTCVCRLFIYMSPTHSFVQSPGDERPQNKESHTRELVPRTLRSGYKLVPAVYWRRLGPKPFTTTPRCPEQNPAHPAHTLTRRRPPVGRPCPHLSYQWVPLWRVPLKGNRGVGRPREEATKDTEDGSGPRVTGTVLEEVAGHRQSTVRARVVVLVQGSPPPSPPRPGFPSSTSGTGGVGPRLDDGERKDENSQLGARSRRPGTTRVSRNPYFPWVRDQYHWFSVYTGSGRTCPTRSTLPPFTVKVTGDRPYSSL